MRTIGFHGDLVPLIEAGTKVVTYRLRESAANELMPGEVVCVRNSQTGALGPRILIKSRRKVPFAELAPAARGHEHYRDQEHMREVLGSYYGRLPADDELITVLRFRLAGTAGRPA